MDDSEDAAKILKVLENAIKTNESLLKRSKETAARLVSRLNKAGLSDQPHSLQQEREKPGPNPSLDRSSRD